uniref:Uncharacterized protein n=1 Tax=Steinernema glaseri TaxID=37863 RepID=A0A1I7Y077_9BILA
MNLLYVLLLGIASFAPISADSPEQSECIAHFQGHCIARRNTFDADKYFGDSPDMYHRGFVECYKKERCGCAPSCLYTGIHTYSRFRSCCSVCCPNPLVEILG